MSKRCEVRVAQRAIRDLEGIHAWISKGSEAIADAWLASTKAAIASLSTSPERCHKAREADLLRKPIRHLIVGKYRVLFTIDGSVVNVLHVRHSAMENARPKDLK